MSGARPTGGQLLCGIRWCPPECLTWRTWCSVERPKCPLCSPCLERYCSQIASQITEANASLICSVWGEYCVNFETVGYPLMSRWRFCRTVPRSPKETSQFISKETAEDDLACSTGRWLGSGRFTRVILWRLYEPQIATASCC